MNTKALAVAAAAVGLGFCGAVAQTWEQVTPPLSMDYPVIASSPDGGTLLLSGYRIDIPIYLSTNGGAAWTTTSAPPGTWGSFAISADRMKLVAAGYGPGAIYTSVDGGANWVSNNVPFAGWTSVAASADGNRLVAVNNHPQTIYTSINGGVLWTHATNAPSAIWRSVASSADGTKLVAVNAFPGTIYTSSDGGTNWVPCTEAPAATWVAAASSADGTKLVALANPGQVYTSADAGISWVPGNLPGAAWRTCAVSADAGMLLVGSQDGFLYTSTDWGVNWKSNSVPVRFWNSVAVSADGSRMFAAADGPNGGIWRSFATPAPRIQFARSTSGLHLGWILPATNFVLQRSIDCAPVDWRDVTDAPVLNSSNLQYEIDLPAFDRMFYRLKSQSPD